MRTIKPFPMLVGERLRQLREARNISVSEAAEHLGKHRTYIWKIETANLPVHLEEITKLAQLYQIDELDLFTFPALSVRHEIIELTRTLPEELLEPLLRECRRALKATKQMPRQADQEVAWKHVHESLADDSSRKQSKQKAG
jgi:transcriptional regulator with XRE-family HTH domain